MLPKSYARALSTFQWLASFGPVGYKVYHPGAVCLVRIDIGSKGCYDHEKQRLTPFKMHEICLLIQVVVQKIARVLSGEST